MREVKVFKWEQQTIDGCRKSVKVFDAIALFHQFGQEADGEGQSNPVAIIERADGQVDTVFASLIQFSQMEVQARSKYPAPRPPASVTAAAPALRHELQCADRIINVILNAMTLEQKSKCAAQLEAEGVSPDGMVRAHERTAALAAAGAA